MCLSIVVENPSKRLEAGTINGFEYEITNNGRGYRCGYLKVLPGHSWHGRCYAHIDAEVHGGLTFSEADIPCDNPGKDNGWWVGFDCAHYFDDPDPLLFGYTQRSTYERLSRSGKVRSTKYVRSQLARLAKQANKKTNID